VRQSILVAALLGLFLASTAIADPGDTLWTRTYGGSLLEEGHSVRQTNDGGYVFAGFTQSFGAGNNDYYLVRSDADGDTLWTRTYGGSSSDVARWVQQTDDNGYIIFGNTASFGAGSNDLYLVKTDSLGDTLWTRTYGGSNSEEGQCAQQTDDGGYAVCGNSSTFGPGGLDVYVVKTDGNGDTLWTRAYGGSATDVAMEIQQTSDGGYIVGGYTGSFGAGGFDFYLLKLDADGDTLWTRPYGGTANDQAFCVAQTDDGGYIMGGYTQSFGAGARDFYIVKTDSVGDTLWTRTYGGTDNEDCQELVQTDDRGYAFAGHTTSFGNEWEFYLVRADEFGDTLWTRTYGGTSVDAAYSVQQTDDYGFILGGRTYSFGAGNYDFYLVKTTPEGSVELTCDDSSPWFCRGKNFYFTVTVNNTTGRTVSGPMTFSAYSGYDCDPGSVMVTITKNKTYGPGITQNSYFFKVPNAATPGQYSASVGGTLGGFELFCCMNTEIRQCSPWKTGGNTEWGMVEVDCPEVGLPTVSSLAQNYPNPFNATTNISFNLAEVGNVSLSVYDITGRLVVSLVDGQMDAGEHLVAWDAASVSSGVYFYKLTTADYTATKKMNLLK
jgi:hypothetical protein